MGTRGSEECGKGQRQGGEGVVAGAAGTNQGSLLGF